MPVPIFTTGEVLTAANMNQVGLWKIASGTLSLTTGATNVIGVFDNTKFKNYRILFNTTARSTTNRIDMRYIAGTTPTSSGYYQGGIASDYASNTTLYMQRSNNDAQFFGISSASAAMSFSFDVFQANIAQPTMHQGHIMDRNSGYTYSFGGVQVANTAFTGFQLFTSSGTATLDYQVFGYRD